MLSHGCLLLLPVLPTLAGAGLALYLDSQLCGSVMVLIGLAGAIGIHFAGRHAHQTAEVPERLIVDGAALVPRLITRMPVPAGTESIRITIPLAMLTEELPALLLSIPGRIRLEVSWSGLWREYMRGEQYRERLLALERELYEHFDEVAIPGTPWQSAYITLETGTTTAIIVPLERTGRPCLYLDVTHVEDLRDQCNRLAAMVFHRSRPVRIGDIDVPTGCTPPRTGFEIWQ